MKLFFRILKIVFTVLGGLLLILLLFPVRLDILWQDAVLRADLSYIFFRKRLSPKDKNGKEKEHDSNSNEEGIDEGSENEEEEKGEEEDLLKKQLSLSKRKSVNDSELSGLIFMAVSGIFANLLGWRLFFCLVPMLVIPNLVVLKKMKRAESSKVSLSNV